MFKLIVLAFLLVGAVTSEDLAAVKAHVTCIAETRMSSAACRRVILPAVPKATSAEHGCRTLEMSEGEFGNFGCSPDDYDILHKIVCEGKDIPCSKNDTKT